MSNEILIAISLGLAIGILMLVEIHVRWGRPVPIGAVGLICVADIMHVGAATTAVGVAIGVFALACFLIERRRQQIFSFLSSSVGAVLVAWAFSLLHHVPIHALKIDDWAVARTVAIAAGYFIFDVASRRILFKQAVQDSLAYLVRIYVAVSLIAVMFTMGWRTQTSALMVVPFIALVVLWRGSIAVRKQLETQAQAILAIGMLPEVARFSPIGHAERMRVFVEALARHLSMSPREVERLTTAAGVREVGYIAYPSAEAIAQGYDVPTKEALANNAFEILSETGFLADIAPLVRDSLTATEENITRDIAILRVVADFDRYFAEDDGQDLRLELDRAVEGAPTGIEKQVADSFRKMIFSHPELLQLARESTFNLMNLRDEMELRMTGHTA